ncbi:terpene synthase family protein [Streptomyces clavuligerus]|uniref:Terpene synthase C domain-containing protein n=1 Tax=Streptomyces clavuligerus TaxID=1901 RepID=E2Q1P2_STRCL|nr:terpene synthase family protein [Streptomyces clavuligerus]ANW16820.1 terpene synthase [Streptomyces clavuligerus]AXU11351.1 terpene synthase [Streptomyces clavuligerus]EFG10668.1 terpene synthase C domain-containing protein [Streptomyces clavuligerus]MBY6301159.1 terpene synthase [Streptomyces clavuligerus]QCS04219.1 terpene synthase [Streptomyces clavuligerus]
MEENAVGKTTGGRSTGDGTGEREGPGGPGDTALLHHAVDGCGTALRLVPGVRRWAGQHGLSLATDIVPQVCLAAAFCGGPDRDPEALALTTRLLTWTYALDDHSDDRTADSGSVAETIEGCLAVLHGAASARAEDPPLVRAFADLVPRALDGLAPPVAHAWQEEAAALLTGTLRERAWADGTAPPPSLAEYLDIGARTIAVALKAITLWCGLREPDLSDRLPQLLPPLARAALAVRLANDLSGHRVERALGIVDALTLGLSVADAEDRVRRHVHECADALRPLTSRGHRPALVVERSARWSVRLYGRYYAGR